MDDVPAKHSPAFDQFEEALRIQFEQKQLSPEIQQQLAALKIDLLTALETGLKDSGKRETSSLADGKIIDAELERVFLGLNPSYSSLFVTLGIKNYLGFKKFLGLEQKCVSPETVLIQYAPGLHKIHIFEKEMNFHIPLGIDEQSIKNYLTIFKHIEGKGDLKNLITEKTLFIPRGGARIDFEIEKDGKKIKYTASPEGVFRIEKDSLGSSEELDFITDTLDSAATKILRLQQDTSITRATFQNSLKALEELRNQKTLLCTRMLFDEKKNIMVREKGDPRFPSVFSLEYVHTDSKNTLLSIGYSQNFQEQLILYDGQNQIQLKIHFYPSGKPQIIHFFEKGENNTSYSFRPDGTVSEVDHKKNGSIYQTDFCDQKGVRVLYKKVLEKEKWISYLIDEKSETVLHFDPFNFGVGDSEEQYITYLAQKLDTPEKLHMYFELYMRYEYDDPRKDSKNTTEGAYVWTPTIDVWQQPKETMCRSDEQGIMLGDCEDFSFLACKILQKQGKNAQVVSLPHHAVCVWTEKKSDGMWHAYSMCNFGYDHNGNRFGIPEDPAKVVGYHDQEEAINSLFPKYTRIGVGVPVPIHYTLRKGYIELCDIPSPGKQCTMEIPIDLLGKPEKICYLFEAQHSEDEKNYEEAKRIYRGLLGRDDRNSFYYFLLGRVLILSDVDEAIGVFNDGLKHGRFDQDLYLKCLDVCKDDKAKIQILNFGINYVFDATVKQEKMHQIAEIYLDQGDTANALQSYELCATKTDEEIKKLSYLYYIAGDYTDQALKKSWACYQQLDTSIPKEIESVEYKRLRVSFYVYFFDTFMEYKDDIFDKKMRQKPNFFKGYPELVLFHTKGIEACTELVKIGSAVSEDYATLSRFYRQEGSFDKAFEQGEMALQKFQTGESNVNAILNNNISEKRKYFVELLQYKVAYFVHKNDIKGASEVCTRFNTHLVFSDIADHIRELGTQSDKLIALYEDILQRPDLSDEHYLFFADNYAHLLKATGKTVELEEFVEKVIKLHPENVVKFNAFLK